MEDRLTRSRRASGGYTQCLLVICRKWSLRFFRAPAKQFERGITAVVIACEISRTLDYMRAGAIQCQRRQEESAGIIWAKRVHVCELPVALLPVIPELIFV